jgi:hypothetical protein
MKVNEVVITEVADTYFNTLSSRLSAMNIHDAIARGTQDSRLRDKAKEWLDKWNNKLSHLKQTPNQSMLTSLLQQLVYSDMHVSPNQESDKAIQQLVDLSSDENSASGIALKYMSKLMTLSLIKPAEEKQIIDYGDYLPNEMLQAGKIVPVKYVIVNDGTVWVKFNGDWYKDTDDSELQVRLHNTPAENIGKLESMKGRDVPMRVGQQGSRTLEFLHRSETAEWFDEYE